MAIEVSNLAELDALISNLDFETTQLFSVCDVINSKLAGVSDIDSMNVARVGLELGKNLSSSMEGLECVVNNMRDYINGIEELDIDDFSCNNDEELVDIESDL